MRRSGIDGIASKAAHCPLRGRERTGIETVHSGAVAQLGEHQNGILGVVSSSLISSTMDEPPKSLRRFFYFIGAAHREAGWKSGGGSASM